MDEYEITPGCLNIAETCAASVSVNDLETLSEDKHAPGPVDLSTKLVYGPIRGSARLRQRVAALCSGAGAGAGFDSDDANPGVLCEDDVLITQGAIGANFLLLYTLVNSGDHVICVYPTYQQLYSVPESLGADVSLWRLKEENGFVPDVSELEVLVKPNTKVIPYSHSRPILSLTLTRNTR